MFTPFANANPLAASLAAGETGLIAGLLIRMHATGPWWAWALLFIAVAGLITWTYLNYFAGIQDSLHHRLPQPENTDGDDTPKNATATNKSEIANLKSEIDPLPPVALFAPGRDEADHLPHTLPELCRQNYGDDKHTLRVVFIDDASTDDTPAICRSAQRHFPERLVVVRNDVEPPPGWVGKCWAIHRGVRQLQTQLEDGEHPTPWLCFTDADIHWHPDLLATAMRYALDQNADVLGVLPTLTFGSKWEAIVQLQLMLALGIVLPIHKAVDPKKKDIALTGGAFILVKREWYDRIGGHEAVKGQVVEDLQIGRRLKREGATMRAAFAGELQWCRMYDGAADQWEGLTKNIYAGLDYSPVKAVALLMATTTLNILPMPLTLFALLWFLVSASWLAGATCVAACLTTTLQARALNAARKLAGPHRKGQPHAPPVLPLSRWYAWTMPIGNAAYGVIVLASMWQAYTKGNAWKGRRYRKT